MHKHIATLFSERLHSITCCCLLTFDKQSSFPGRATFIVLYVYINVPEIRDIKRFFLCQSNNRPFKTHKPMKIYTAITMRGGVF